MLATSDLHNVYSTVKPSSDGLVVLWQEQQASGAVCRIEGGAMIEFPYARTTREIDICALYYVMARSKTEIAKMYSYRKIHVDGLVKRCCPVRIPTLEVEMLVNLHEAASLTGQTYYRVLQAIENGSLEGGELRGDKAWYVWTSALMKWLPLIEAQDLARGVKLPPDGLTRYEWAVIRFTKRIETGPNCWEWQGSKTQARYGRLRWYGRYTYAHRLAYELCYGPIPNGLEICHHCDNPPCCRPDHLFAGTHKENIHDSIRKGRFWRIPQSERRRRKGSVVLNAEQKLQRRKEQRRRWWREHCSKNPEKWQDQNNA